MVLPVLVSLVLMVLLLMMPTGYEGHRHIRMPTG